MEKACISVEIVRAFTLQFPKEARRGLSPVAPGTHLPGHCPWINYDIPLRLGPVLLFCVCGATQATGVIYWELCPPVPTEAIATAAS